MRTKLLLIVLILITSVSYGQITITAEDGYIPFEKIPYTYIKNKGTTLPDTGKNVVWDYSHFVPCDNCESIIEYRPNKHKDFSNSERMIPFSRIVLGFRIPSTEFQGLNEEGDLYILGVVAKSQTIPLKRLSGHPMDRLKVEDYENRTAILEYDFPFEYGKKWTTSSADTTRMLLNAPSVNIKDLRIQEIIADTVYQSIEGYGKLTLPYFKDGKTQTFTYDALLLKKVKIQKVRIESELEELEFDNLLQLAGLSRVAESTCLVYKFYVKEMPLFVLTLSDCSETGIIQRARLRTDLDRHPPKDK